MTRRPVRTEEQIARGELARRLVGRGALHPLTALDFASNPKFGLEELERRIKPHPRTKNDR